MGHSVLRNSSFLLNKVSYSLSDIKLVIWDLDDSFWSGTLSEGTVDAIPLNISLIKALCDRGIVCSICSNNNPDDALRQLDAFGVLYWFVFASIDWTPKGQRISALLNDMGLRPANCLFIDDSPTNLAEAVHYCPGLMTSGPDVIPDLMQELLNLPIKDPSHSRLAQYKVLEKRVAEKKKNSDNTEFLRSSSITVEFHSDCLDYIDRLHELVERTNQLNFTKLRSSRSELESLLKDPSVNAGYLTVSDRFGDYGIVGFYAIKRGELIHFLFSCRILGQGIERYAYSVLGRPSLRLVGPVATRPDSGPEPDWINNTIEEHGPTSLQHHEINKGKIVFKGPCDLNAMSEYLETKDIIKEFTYVSRSRGNFIEHHNHSVNYLQWPFLGENEKSELLQENVFNDEDMFNTAMYDNDVSILFVSTLIEPNLGIYERKRDGFRIAFGESSYPLTDVKNWPAYIQGTIFTAQNSFTEDWLAKFRAEWVFKGALTPSEILSNAQKLLSLVSPQARVCFILGSEQPFLANDQHNYDERHRIYAEMNPLFRQLSQYNPRVLLLDINQHIHSQDDFTNNINHFKRRVYYDMAIKAQEYIAAATGDYIPQKSRIYLWWRSFIDTIGKTGFFQGRAYAIIRRILGKEKNH